MGNSMATGMVFINIQGTCPKILTNEIACKLKKCKNMGHFKKLLLLTMVGNLEEKWICCSCEKGPSNH
jgi:hypothetical protein